MIEPFVYSHTMQNLVRMLPPPGQGTPDDYVELAIEQMAALAPANAAEACIAAQYIACTAQAADCMRRAQVADPATAQRWAACGASTLRLASSARKQLMQVQALRRKRDADPVTRAQDEATREACRRAMQQALAELPVPARQCDAAAAPSHGPRAIGSANG
ncbi:MAG TPA: hypothetical protein VMU81_16935 [Acetobacteraceae bacterium]|jgi:hypothetical protein|nr:hypothetical protein [Acetobacteraceae bacterium]